MIRYSPLLLVLLLMSFGKCNPKVNAPSSNTQTLNPAFPNNHFDANNNSFSQFAPANHDGFEIFDDDRDDDEYLNYGNDSDDFSSVPTLSPSGRPPKKPSTNPWVGNPITFDSTNAANESTPVLCKHAQACEGGFHQDALMGKNACQAIYAIRDLSQCKKTRKDGPLKTGYDVNCSCVDVCSPKELRKKPNTLADQGEEQLNLGDILSEDDLTDDPDQNFLNQMAAMDLTEKFNNFAKFDPAASIPDGTSDQAKQELFQNKIRDVLNGKATTIPGSKNLKDMIAKQPIFKSLLKEAMLKSTEPTTSLGKRFEVTKKKLELNDDPMQFNLDRIKDNLDSKEPMARRKAIIQIENENSEKELIAAMPIKVPGFETEGNDIKGPFEKVCLYRPGNSGAPCESYIKKYDDESILIPEGTKIDNILLEDVPDDLKEAVAKADMEKCWKETNCKEIEKKFGDEQELLSKLSSRLPSMNLSDSPKINPNNERMSYWNECDESRGFTGNYHGRTKNSECATNRHISKDFGSFLNDNFALCTNVALASIGRDTAAKVHMTHKGIQGDANHNARSLHSVARAIDVKEIKVTYPDGTQESFDHYQAYQNKGDNNPFYVQFRKCWSDKVTEKNRPCNRRSLENRGSIGHEHRDHKYHLHLSLPYCPRQGYYSK